MWIARGYSLSRRMRHLEERWAYYFAFGAFPLYASRQRLTTPQGSHPLPFACGAAPWPTQPSSPLSSPPYVSRPLHDQLQLTHPKYTLMAMHARPQPLDPYNPTQSDPVQHPSPFVPIRFPVFTPVVWLNDIIIRVLSLVGSFGGPRPITGAASPGSHRRVPSDSVESVEEGEAGVELSDVKPMQPPAGTGATRIRVRRGSRSGTQVDRRKLD